MPPILETLAAELERPRQVTAQVINHLTGTYGLSRDDVGTFLEKELSGLEEYEIDLILSPLFTPTLRDQAVFADLLGQNSIPSEQWPSLIARLVSRPTRAQLMTDDSQTHRLPLRDVTIERFVHRLRLDATIAEPLFQMMTNRLYAADQPILKAIARRATWEDAKRQEILFRYLKLAAEIADYQLSDAVELLKLAETYTPADTNDLLARIPHWQQVLRQEINEAGGAKPFFNERVEELHGGGRDQRRQSTAIANAKENELAFLGRLQRVLAG